MARAMERMFEQAQTMPSIPKALQAVMESLNKEDPNINDIVEPLALDPTLSAKVLRMSNAAHFGLPRQVSSIDDAVRLVGVNAVRTMVLSSGLMSTFDDIPGFDLKAFWRTTLIASIVAKDIARFVDVNPEEAYTAALMHGLGILAIHRVLPDIAQKIEQHCENTAPQARARSEMNHLGFTSCQVGQSIAVAWKLPDNICTAILCHAFPYRNTSSALAAVVHVALVLANDLENQVPLDQWATLLVDEVLQRVGFARQDIRLHPENWEGVRDSVHGVVS